jgi:putative aminopeptidase FrvX
MWRDLRPVTAVLIIFCLILITHSAAGSESLVQLVEKLCAIPSPTGYEHLMAEAIMRHFEGQGAFSRDNLGSLYLSVSSGTPIMAVVTSMDEIGYVVSGITEHGYLNLDRGVPSPHGLYDTYQAGHPVRIWTEGGPVNGLWVLPSSHTLSRVRRQRIMQELTLENALVDIGAQSREDAVRRGVAYLDPVTAVSEMHHLAGGQLSAPCLGSKSCTALQLDSALKAYAARDARAAQFVWLAQAKIVRRRSDGPVCWGALAARKRISAPMLLVIDTFTCPEGAAPGVVPGQGPVLMGAGEDSPLAARIAAAAQALGIPLQTASAPHSPVMVTLQDGERDVAALLLPVKFAATPSEVVWREDLSALQSLVFSLLTREGVGR